MFMRRTKTNGNNKPPKASDWWNARASIVKTRTAKLGQFKYESPEELWEACLEYFQWSKDNPILEEKVFCNNGRITRTNLSHIRAMTIDAMCLFLGIIPQTWINYQNDGRLEFALVPILANIVVRSQKFTGAAAGLLQANIIARDLGLRDNHEITGAGGGPIQMSRIPVDLDQLSDKNVVSDEEFDILLALSKKLTSKGKKEIMHLYQ